MQLFLFDKNCLPVIAEAHHRDFAAVEKRLKLISFLLRQNIFQETLFTKNYTIFIELCQ